MIVLRSLAGAAAIVAVVSAGIGCGTRTAQAPLPAGVQKTPTMSPQQLAVLRARHAQIMALKGPNH